MEIDLSMNGSVQHFQSHANPCRDHSGYIVTSSLIGWAHTRMIPGGAEFIWDNIKICLHAVPFLCIEMMKAVENLPGSHLNIKSFQVWDFHG